jgi:preprotein translocase subunit SecA
MTGTAQTSAEEFHKVYKLEVVTIPTNRGMIRKDEKDLVYKTIDAKYNAIIEDIKQRHAKGQPVLVGTVSIEKNEEFGRRLTRAGLPHQVLNAKNNEKEGSIIAQAGKYAAITVATNMAGRGVDIILGGNPPDIVESQKVKDVGGLHVIGTERHESRRIDNQLRGRAGRQGDPGSSQFFLSMEDDLVRVFGGDRIKSVMERLKIPDDMPIQAGILSRALEQAQSKVEGHHFDSRKHLLDYDDVLNKQRLAIYKKRQMILMSGKLQVALAVNADEAEVVEEKTEEVTLGQVANRAVLGMLDTLWMNHLEDMEALQESVRLRAVGQHDPLVEYRREGHQLYTQMLANFEQWFIENREKIEETERQMMSQVTSNNSQVTRAAKVVENLAAPVAEGDASSPVPGGAKEPGRNDPCYCGSGKKFKKCHGA